MIEAIKELLTNNRLGQKIFIFQSHLTNSIIKAPSLKYKFALSLLPKLDSTLSKPQSIFAWCLNDNPQELYNLAIDNPIFINYMQNTIKQSKDELAHILASRAKRQATGWLDLVDERAPLVYGRTPEPDDIIGFCKIEQGQVLPETYDPMPSYRLVSRSGPFSLPKPLWDKLLLKD